MRSFKSKILSAVACVAPVLAAALPGHGEVARQHNEPLPLHLGTLRSAPLSRARSCHSKRLLNYRRHPAELRASDLQRAMHRLFVS
jgi:hypothetical protein